MIFCRRSYMSPEATVKICTHSGSSSAVIFAPACLPAAGLAPSHDDILPHTDPATRGNTLQYTLRSIVCSYHVLTHKQS